MAKKIRLVDGEPVEENTSADTPESTGELFTPEQVAQLMKYAEAMDWKLWEILKILRAQTDTEGKK